MRNVCNALATRNLPPLKLKRNNRNKNKWQEENKLLIFLSCCVILPPGQNMIFCFRWYYKLVWCEQTTGSMTRTTHMWHGRRTKKNEFNKSTFVIWQFFLKQRLFLFNGNGEERIPSIQGKRRSIDAVSLSLSHSILSGFPISASLASACSMSNVLSAFRSTKLACISCCS